LAKIRRPGRAPCSSTRGTAGPLLADVLDTDDYPLATRIGAAAGKAHASAHAPGHAHTFDLDRILAALDYLAPNSPTPASPSSDR